VDSDVYRPNIIREYRYWTLFLNTKQKPYVGRCYAWFRDSDLRRGEGLRLDELPVAAIIEYSCRIFPDVVRACKALGYATEKYGQEFLLNTCYLANEKSHNHHMHVHYIPRSANPVTLHDIDLTCNDLRWGHNYTPLASGVEQHLEGEKLFYIRDVMREATKDKRAAP